ncbi:hypothetical protein [Rhizobium leguminosarum]|uniref:hypothetical protein n=1 Tax=Rhizobium leguminosarum TaxID=384 RepID=UPI001182EC27|nr:hypothetical protein [Rhizobium leguminosarum]NKK78585.1 hypothetical protein [Rhizobium leguminosarum bv. viciae]
MPLLFTRNLLLGGVRTGLLREVLIFNRESHSSLSKIFAASPNEFLAFSRWNNLDLRQRAGDTFTL